MSPEITELISNTIITEDYEGWINLPAWEGFENRAGSYSSKNSSEQSDGIVKVHVMGFPKDGKHILTYSQFKAIRFIKNNAEIVRDSLLKVLFNELPKIKEMYDDDDAFPIVNNIDDFKQVLGIGFIHIMDCEKDDFAYIGFELGCSWDEEHGVGIMMYRNDVIKVGLADESFNHWTCYEDNGTKNTYLEMNKSTIKEKDKSKWWKFW